MAILIPTLNSCLPRMTAGEKKVANFLEAYLEDDYYCWYDVPIGRQSLHPDFIVLHPYRGLLILEVKDWKPTTLIELSKDSALILDNDTGKNVTVANPIEQARKYVHVLINILSKDPQLNIRVKNQKISTVVSYGYGVVLTNITREQFDKGELGEAIPAHCVICKDELTNQVSSEEFQERLWEMFPYALSSPLSLPQIDRIRWHIFPELRIGGQTNIFDDLDKKLELPDIVKVMDLQQEQLARSLGEGHRIIHGVAGSGKTMILGYRAEYLVNIMQRPILILCYNRPLAGALKYRMEQNGLSHKVHVRTFHAWCDQQLRSYNIPKSRNTNISEMFEENVQKVIDHAETGVIPKGQYDAILIDEGHDFKDEWFKLIVQMVNPSNPCLLVLYDDAQSIYSKDRRKIVFSHVGIKAVGRTNILKLNYRNTKEILTVAKLFAEDLLKERDADEDGIPLLEPIGAGLNGKIPLLIKLPTMHQEIQTIVNALYDHQRNGVDWNEMAVLCRTNQIINQVSQALSNKGIPIHGQEVEGEGVHLITIGRSKGLEFSLVCIPGVGNQGVCYDSKENEAQLLYVAMTRATRNLVMTCHDSSMFVSQIETAISQVINMN